MINDPENHPLLRFADQRVRMAEAIVELHNRVPCAIYRLLFEMLRLDDYGRLDIKTLMRQNFALFESFNNQPEMRGTVVVLLVALLHKAEDGSHRRHWSGAFAKLLLEKRNATACNVYA